jgi:hypothetical protein
LKSCAGFLGILYIPETFLRCIKGLNIFVLQEKETENKELETINSLLTMFLKKLTTGSASIFLTQINFPLLH